MELMNTKFGLSGTNGEHLLERLDLPVIRKQFLDQDTEFLRFKITLPDNLSGEVIPQFIATETNQQIDVRLLILEAESDSGSKRTINRYGVAKIGIIIFYDRRKFFP